MINLTENQEKIYAETKRKDKNVQQDPVKYLKQQMLVMDSLEKARDPEYQSKLAAEQNSKPIKKNGSFLIPLSMSANQELITISMLFTKKKKTALSKPSLTKTTKAFWEAGLGSIVGRHLRRQQKNKQRFHFIWTNFRIFNAKS
jgi:hypothetical protein